MEKLKSIRNTYLYDVFNKNGAFDAIVSTFMTKGIVATDKMLDTEYSNINNYFKFPLKGSVMEAVKDGIVIPMMYPKGITAQNKVPTNLPFILTSADGVVKAIAIIDNYAKEDASNEGRVIIDANKLYCLLESAYIARAMQVNFDAVRNNTTMYTEGSAIYAHMFTRVLNKQFALNVDKDAFSKVLFLAAKFFLINLLGMKDSDMVFNYAIKTSGVSPVYIKKLDDSIPASAYTNIAEFIKAISANAHLIIMGLDKLTVRGYVDSFIRMYSNAALFSLEHISYFIFNILSCINHAYMNNQYAFDEAIGSKSGEKIYGHLASRLRNMN